MNKLDNINPETRKFLSEATDKFNKSMEPHKEAIIKMGQVLKEVPESTKILAEYGWYLPLEFNPSTINYYASEIKTGNSNLVDNKMANAIDEEILNIENELIDNFPHRKAPIQAAIRAHNNGDYYLSIPVFFAQIEGLCNELTGYRFFSTRKKKPVTAAWTSNFRTNSTLEILLEPLRHTGVTRQKQDSKNPLGTNRHDVLHGDSNDYGNNKFNSYKALSLLNYIGETVFISKQDIKE